MIMYGKVINEETGICEVGTGTNVEFYKSIGYIELDVKQSDIDNCYYLAEKCPMKTAEDKAKEEAERISHLKCTKRVLALCLEEYGIKYTQLKELIATDERAQLEWELCVELERNNPLLDIMGAKLNITPEQIDRIFLFANGELKNLK